MPNEQILNLLANPEPIYVSNYIAQNVHFSIEDKQAILEELYPTRRLALINKLLNHELDILSIEKELNDSAQSRWRAISASIICGGNEGHPVRARRG